MNKEEFIGKLQMCYFGDRNAFNEIVELFDKMQKENKKLNKQVTEYQDEIFARDNSWYDMQD